MAANKITIRASEAHIAKLNKLSSKLAISKTALLKKIIDDGVGQIVELNNPTLTKHYDAIEKMLSTMSNNVNQIAKKINAGGKVTENENQNFITYAKNLEKLQTILETKNQTTTFKGPL